MHMSGRYCIARLNIGRIKLVDLSLAVTKADCQTAKFNSQPNFRLYSMYLEDCDPDHSWEDQMQQCYYGRFLTQG